MFFDVNRHQFFVLLVWNFEIIFIGQLIFPIYSNYLPNWQCGNGPVGKDCSEFERCRGNVTFVDQQFSSTALEFGFICGPEAYYRSLFPQAQFLGVLLGTVSFGTLSDAFGRKPISIFTVSLGVLMNFLTGFASSWNILLGIRFILGLSIGGSAVVVITLCMEMLLPKQRMVLRTICNWGIARMTLTLVCWLFPEWRSASMACAFIVAPSILIIIVLFPESPIWLHNKGRLEEMVKAEKFIARIAGVEYQPVEHKKIEHVKTFCELISTGGIYKRLLVLWFMWFCACLCSYSADFNSGNLSGNLFLNQFYYGILIYFSKLVLLGVDTSFPGFSRRMLHQGAQSLGILCFLALTILSINQYQGILLLLFNLVGIVFIEYTWDACHLCAVEAMETSCRSSATGSCSLVARIGALIAPMLNYVTTIWPPAVYAAVLVFGSINLLVSYFFLVETKTVNLDDVNITDEETEGTPMLEKGKK